MDIINPVALCNLSELEAPMCDRQKREVLPAQDRQSDGEMQKRSVLVCEEFEEEEDDDDLFAPDEDEKDNESNTLRDAHHHIMQALRVISPRCQRVRVASRRS